MIRAPGKLFATGAYAVLEGAPAVVLAVDRYACAPGAGEPRPEVEAVARLLGKPPPRVDVTAFEQHGRKLGLGSSAAAAVAAAALLLESVDRDRVLEVARAAHARVQPRGSGADVAACTHGGVVVVRGADVRRAELPPGLALRAFACGRAMRTSDALDRLAERRTAAAPALDAIVDAAERGARAVFDRDLARFVAACAAHVEGLAALGRALDLPLVPTEVDRARDVLGLPPVAESAQDVVLLPSGAGGGDTVLWLSARAPTEQEAASLARVGLEPLDLAVDTFGVHSRS